MIQGKQTNNLGLLKPTPKTRAVPSQSLGSKIVPVNQAYFAEVNQDSPEVQESKQRKLANNSAPLENPLEEEPLVYREVSGNEEYRTELPVSKGTVIKAASDSNPKGLPHAPGSSWSRAHSIATSFSSRASTSTKSSKAKASQGLSIHKSSFTGPLASTSATSSMGVVNGQSFNTEKNSDTSTSKNSSLQATSDSSAEIAGTLANTGIPAEVTVAGQTSTKTVIPFVASADSPNSEVSRGGVTQGPVSPISKAEVLQASEYEKSVALQGADNELLEGVSNTDLVQEDPYEEGENKVASLNDRSGSVLGKKDSKGYGSHPLDSSLKSTRDIAIDIKSFVVSSKKYKSSPEGAFTKEMVDQVFSSHRKYSTLPRTTKSEIYQVYTSTTEPSYEDPGISSVPEITKNELVAATGDCPPVGESPATPVEQSTAITAASQGQISETQVEIEALSSESGSTTDTLTPSLKGDPEKESFAKLEASESKLASMESDVGDSLALAQTTPKEIRGYPSDAAAQESSTPLNQKLSPNHQEIYNQLKEKLSHIPSESEATSLPDSTPGIYAVRAYYSLGWVSGTSLNYEGSPVYPVTELLKVVPINKDIDPLNDQYEFPVEEYSKIVKSLEFHSLKEKLGVNALGQLATSSSPVAQVPYMAHFTEVAAEGSTPDGPISRIEFDNGLAWDISATQSGVSKLIYKTRYGVASPKTEINHGTNVVYQVTAPPGTSEYAKSIVESTGAFIVSEVATPPSSKDLNFVSAVSA